MEKKTRIINQKKGKKNNPKGPLKKKSENH